MGDVWDSKQLRNKERGKRDSEDEPLHRRPKGGRGTTKKTLLRRAGRKEGEMNVPDNEKSGQMALRARKRERVSGGYLVSIREKENAERRPLDSFSKGERGGKSNIMSLKQVNSIHEDKREELKTFRLKTKKKKKKNIHARTPRGKT